MTGPHSRTGARNAQQAAAEVAREAADAAQGYAGIRWRLAATVATGGGVDPTVFRIAIFGAQAISSAITWSGRITPAFCTRRVMSDDSNNTKSKRSPR